MPLYELFCISRASIPTAQTKSLLSTTITHVLARGGIVRHIEHLGVRPLPYRIKQHQEIFTTGRLLSVYFDASPSIKNGVDAILRHDERVVRYGFVKISNTLGQMTRVTKEMDMKMESRAV